ncbi:MAG: alkaline phosphatase family protein, partial [Clostridia bacterium]|nr:alkaline phosphatase family protein [Clostridia bacterium]
MADGKVILMSIDGMRPDGLLKCGEPFVEEMMRRGQYTLTGRTVFPSVTLPCHTSLFYSLPPERHGITTNTYTPPVHPVNGLTTVIHNVGKKSVMFYGWEPIRDVARPLDMVVSEFVRARSFDDTDTYLIDRGMECIARVKPDFAFLYQVETDEKGGHDQGWMSEGYLAILANAIR